MKNAEAMWVVIHMAHSPSKAERVRALLTDEGFLVRVRPIARALSSGDSCFEVLVLTSEAAEARDVLHESGL